MDASRKTTRHQSPPHPIGVEGHEEWPYDDLTPRSARWQAC